MNEVTTESRAVLMNRFLAEVEKKAFLMARYATRDPDEALDIVQDSMFTLARKYSAKPVEQWRPLFFGILKNRITDWHRRAGVRGKLFSAVSNPVGQDDCDPAALAAAPAVSDPMVRSNLDGAMDRMRHAVERLPTRQQQAFLLRTLEGMNVAETAKAMRCSQGSVKTHYSRAVHTLREWLEDHWQ